MNKKHQTLIPAGIFRISVSEAASGTALCHHTRVLGYHYHCADTSHLCLPFCYPLASAQSILCPFSSSQPLETRREAWVGITRKPSEGKNPDKALMAAFCTMRHFISVVKSQHAGTYHGSCRNLRS